MPLWSIITLQVLAIPLIWCAVVGMIGFLSGWQRLAKVYPLSEPIEKEKTVGMQSLNLSMFSRYNNCITFGVSDKGMSIRVMSIFRIGHPPMFIPWEDMLAEDIKVYKFIPMVRLILLKDPKRKVLLREGHAKRLAKLAGEYWPKSQPVEQD
jgi:hypothetical protein